MNATFLWIMFLKIFNESKKKLNDLGLENDYSEPLINQSKFKIK